MNLLIDDLPETVNGIPIYTDYRNMVQFELLMQDEELSGLEKASLALNLLYREPVPDFQTAWDGLLWYHHKGMEPQVENGEKHRQRNASTPLYDFEQDAGYIYAAFWQVYRIDLQTVPLHWWTFRELLFHLPDTCMMGKIMQIRGVDLSEMKGAEKKHYQKMKAIFAIRRKDAYANMTAAEREQQLRERVLERYQEAQKWLSEKNK